MSVAYFFDVSSSVKQNAMLKASTTLQAIDGVPSMWACRTCEREECILEYEPDIAYYIAWKLDSYVMNCTTIARVPRQGIACCTTKGSSVAIIFKSVSIKVSTKSSSYSFLLPWKKFIKQVQAYALTRATLTD